MRVVIVTGLSGAGKSTALRALEDIEFYCIDNLPLPLVSSVIQLMDQGNVENVAFSVDARQHVYLEYYHREVGRLRETGHHVEVLFLEASDDHLIRRYSETRRRHPLAGDRIRRGIDRDREILAELRHGAAVVNTGSLNVHQLKGVIQERYGRRDGRLAVTLLSFGYRNGLPPEADLVFDVRFLPNPYFDPDLSGRDGKDPRVAEYVLGSEEGRKLLAHVHELMLFTLPQFEREGKLYLTVAVGCTAGRHRSVAVVEELRSRMGEDWEMSVRHRDLESAV